MNTILHLISGIEDFSEIDGGYQNDIASLAELYDHGPGKVLFDEGDIGPGIFIIVAGQIDLIQRANGSNPVHIDTYHNGAVLGLESIQSLPLPSPHQARTGPEGAVVQIISREGLAAYFKDNQTALEQVNQSRSLSLLVQSLANAPSFRNLPRSALLELARQTKTRSHKIGHQLIVEGKVEDHLYVVKSGRFFVTRHPEQNIRIAERGPGSVIGEMAVLNGTKRTASVTSETETEVFQIPGKIFRKIVSEHEDLAKHVHKIIEERQTQFSKQDNDALSLGPKSGQSNAKASVAPDDMLNQTQADSKKRIAGKSLWQKIFRRPAVVLQHSEMDCGAACICTIIKHYGKTISINAAREVARVRQEGASLANIVRALKQFGFEPESFLSTIDQLREKKLPVIANWKGYHWVVVHEVNDTEVLVADPAQGLTTYSIDEFLESWTRHTIFLTPTTAFEELEESQPTFQNFKHYFAPYLGTIAEIFAGAFFLLFLSVMLPLFTKFVLDEVILKGDEQWLTLAMMVMVGITIVNVLMSFIRDEMILRLSMRINLDIVSSVYDHLMRLPISFFENRQIGDITQRLKQQETITEFLTEGGLETILGLLLAATYLVFMIYFNVWLTVWAVGFLLLNIFVIQYISPKIQQVNKESFAKEAEQESHLIESLKGAVTLKTIGADNVARWQYENHFAGVSNLQFKEARFSQTAGVVVSTLESFGDISILFFGGILVINGEMSIGELIAFTVFANGIQAPIKQLIGKWDELQDTFLAVERLNDILEKEPEFDNNTDTQKLALPTIRGDIDFEETAFRYEPDDPDNVLQNINLNMAAGTTVALVGTSGCGKSTLIKLLYGFYKPSSGKVLIDGFDLAEVTLPSLRKQIAIVPQTSAIFRGTVFDNIALSRPGATMDEVEDAARCACAHEFIAKMPGGYESILEERGANLSGGQRQRIAIARVFLQRASVLVLDEATSALDNETERTVMDNIRSHFEERTVIIIAHRLSTVQNADCIVVLNGGLISEMGTHEELMSKRSLYYHLNVRQKSVG